MKTNTKRICITGLGVALYVALSMAVKIPLFVGHIALDLGYVVLAVYCRMFGGVTGAIVGGCGCVLVSLLASGWFPPGWLVGNLFIGFVCGKFYRKGHTIYNLILTVSTVYVGVGVIKILIECALFSIPLAAKAANGMVAGVADAIAMCVGLIVAKHIPSNLIGIEVKR